MRSPEQAVPSPLRQAVPSLTQRTALFRQRVLTSPGSQVFCKAQGLSSQSYSPGRYSSRQAGATPRVDSMVSQPDSTVPLAESSQASASQEARSFPNRHNTPLGSYPLEEPNPKWLINLSSKPLTPAQRSVLAKGPNFVVTPRHPLT